MKRSPIKRKPSKSKPAKKMTLRRKCDTLCSQLARFTAGSCARCSTTEHLQWSHHVSRRYLAVRYDPTNYTVHCRACHMFFTNNPLEHEEWIIGHIGAEAYADLKQRARELKHYRPDYKSILADLEKRLRRPHDAA